MGRINRDGLLVALFSLALIVPATTHVLGLWQATPQSEHRNLSEAPAWPTNAEKWRVFAPTLESYVSDRIGLRPWLLTTGHRLRFLIGAPVNPDVVVGKRGWLFFNGDDEINQYLGVRLLSDLQIHAIVDELERYRVRLQAKGALFIFVIAPNKTSVYSEYLPGGLHPIGPTPADQLMSALTERPEILAVDGRNILRRSKSIGPLYFQTDTHWNDTGAYVVLKAAMDHLGFGNRLRPLRDYRIAFTPRSTDLLFFLNLGRYIENIPELEENFPATKASWAPYNPNGPVTNVVTTPSPARGRIVIVGDSFSYAWIKFLAAGFARVVRIVYPSDPMQSHISIIEAEKPDVVVLEIVERGLLHWWPKPPEN
jgi:alginate O-acetyltransferase complex protein AlgJ